MLVVRAVVAHLLYPLAVSIVTVREKTADVLAATYARLTGSINELGNWHLVSLTVGASLRYNLLKQQKLNVGGNDLRIAAIALETGATVVTRNRRDFGRIPGVTIEDWSI